MKNLIFGFLLIALTAGCTPKIFRDLGMRPVSSVTTYRGNLMPTFDNIEEAKYYTVQINYKENALSGMMAVNQPEKGKFRLIMMTAFGMPIFDFSMSQDSFVVNSCMEQMNKKIVLDILEKDFRSLFMLNVPNKFSAIYYKSPSFKNHIGYEVKTKDGGCSYLLYPRGNNYVRNIQTGGCIKRMNATFDEQVVTLSHPKLGLQIIMSAVSNE